VLRRYTRHARLRMRERGVTEAEVEETLRQPDITYPDGKGNVNFVKGKLRVVATPDGGTVITVVRL
jgi:hypothetical protein